ncbi:MAG TPA: hypothetical protein DIS94_11865 [Bacteroidetes bacterium]|nr:hypothetical protein [Bacteroidota bacterium]
MLFFTELFAISNDSNLVIENDSDCIVSEYIIKDTVTDSTYLKNMFTTVYGNVYQLEFGIVYNGKVKVYIADIDSNVICKIIDSEFDKGKYLFELIPLLFNSDKFHTNFYRIKFYFYPFDKKDYLIKKDTAFILIKSSNDENQK